MRGASTQEAKQALRSAGLARRAALAEADCRLLSRPIQVRALNCIATSPATRWRSTARYKTRSTDELLARASGGKKVFIHASADDGDGLFRVLAADELRAGRYGILEPAGTTRLADVEFEALTIFVPA
jgi:5-formyltetrahydrofolate cyclo-ligase